MQISFNYKKLLGILNTTILLNLFIYIFFLYCKSRQICNCNIHQGNQKWSQTADNEHFRR